MIDAKVRHLKYPLFLFLVILIAKVGYVAVESFYNYHVLLVTTNAELSQTAIEELNLNGHRISSVGITLLLVPFFYLLARSFPKPILYTTLIVLSVATYFGTYNLLNKMVDYIVETNKDKRHDAYYVNVFKYGILNNIFVYDSFINNKKIQDGSISINDRILLTNTFLLLHADETLIEKLKQRGKEKVADIYINKHKKEDYEQRLKDFTTAANKVQLSWIQFNNARNKLNEKLTTLEDINAIKKAHQSLLSSLRNQYDAYVQGWKDVQDKIQKETAPNRLEDIQSDLKKYFRYQNNSNAQKQYHDTMYKNFGHNIKPERWLDANGNVTTIQSKKVIKDEIIKKANNQLKDMKEGLSQQAFAYHIDVKVEISKRLQNEGILIPYDFDYSYTQFKKYYNIAAIKVINNAPNEFYKQLKEKIGPNDLKLTYTWDDFINSRYIKDKIQTEDGNDLTSILNVIRSQDLGNFKRLIYLPKVVNEVEKMMYKSEDFKDGREAEKIGDDAIKLLYIPPFALSVSIIALLLNLVTVFGMLLTSTRMMSGLSVNIAKALLTLAIILTPLLNNYTNLDNDLLENIKTPELTMYLNFLEWISYYEQVNAGLHQVWNDPKH